MIGERISHYEIEERLGEGGMGVVYRARDLRLNRTVAIKFLPPEAELTAEEKARFLHEAQAASALDHKNIGTIHEVDETPDGRSFIVMAHYGGPSLRERLKEAGPLPIDEALTIAIQMAEGLEAAHRKGIVHRDVKPANVMLSDDGEAKLVDFGIAKLTGQTRLTRTGSTIGTLAYMSPEQARGEDVGPRSDAFSVGCVLYEMLTGRSPFEAGSDAARLHAILHTEPEPVSSLRAEAPEQLDRVLNRALAKDPDRRTPSAGRLAEELRSLRAGIARAPAPASLRGVITRPPVLAGAAAVVVVAGWIGYGVVRKASVEQWAREVAIPEVTRLVGERRFLEALAVAEEAERHIPGDPTLERLVANASVEMTVETDPPGARLYYQRYLEPASEWVYAGTSPLEGVRWPTEYLRVRAEAEGFESLEVGRLTYYGSLYLSLTPEGSGPPGMLRVDGSATSPVTVPTPVAPFWIDRYEVRNRDYRAFVEEGGYEDPSWWAAGREVGEDGLVGLMDGFRDRTGRSGPAGWSLGRPPEGEEDHPVSGVSWYEAAAYCAWAGRSLPTLYHWSLAAAPMAGDVRAEIVRVSNFGRRGAWPADSTTSLGPYGTLDMAGNVREWVWNASVGQNRYALGGSWNDPEYSYQQPQAWEAADRDEELGFRCALYDEQPPEVLLEPVPRPIHDFRGVEPVDDSTYATFRSLFAFEGGPLRPDLESTSHAPEWRQETITIAAAYADERFRVHLFLPLGVAPPYQPVLFVPGGTASALPSSDDLADLNLVDFIPRTGRVLVYPVYHGTYERRSTTPISGDMERISRYVRTQQDLIRTVDYLATRDDMDLDRLGYVGLSAGGEYGPLRLALEERIDAAVFLGGGYDASHMQNEPPQISPWNYAPRVTIPVLMLNGRYDWGIPVETGQIPMYRMLGTPDEHKDHKVADGGHVPPQDFLVRETLNWFDRYLGPVGR